jgi:hypothetical protein
LKKTKREPRDVEVLGWQGFALVATLNMQRLEWSF